MKRSNFHLERPIGYLVLYIGHNYAPHEIKSKRKRLLYFFFLVLYQSTRNKK